MKSMAEIEFLPPPLSSSEASGPVEPVPASSLPDGDKPISESHRPSPSGTIFRMLTPDEIQAHVLPDYERSGNPLPAPSDSTFIGALESDQVVAYLCLQVKLHAQPLVIRPGHSDILKSLIRAAESHILSTIGPTWVYLFTPAGRLSQIASTMGMQLEPWCVMSKLVAPEPPERPAFEIVPAREPDPGPFPERGQYQARGNESSWEELFPNGVLPIDSTGRVQ